MRTLVPLAIGFEEIEAVCVIDVLRRAELTVDVAGVGSNHIKGAHGILVQSDIDITEAKGREYDLMALPGGMPGVSHLAEDPVVLDLVKRQYESGKWLAAICAAPLVLEKAGVLPGKRITSHFSIADQLPSAIYAGDRVVVDGRIVTSRGAGTAMEFSLKLVSLLCGPDKAREISESMLNGMPF